MTSRIVTLREPTLADTGPLFDLLSVSDATRFGIDEEINQAAIARLIEGAIRRRTAGLGFAFAVTLGTSANVIGLFDVRQLDPTFEAAEWEATLAPSVRGTGAFVEASRLIGSFAFGTVGVHRLEARALVQNGRANGALKKIGAVQEGVLRRSVRRGHAYLDQALWSLLKEDWADRSFPIGTRVH